MKRLKFGLVGLLFISLVASMVININLKYGAIEENKDFILTNVEALAQGENGDNDCTGSGSLICGGGLYKVRVTR